MVVEKIPEKLPINEDVPGSSSEPPSENVPLMVNSDKDFSVVELDDVVSDENDKSKIN